MGNSIKTKIVNKLRLIGLFYTIFLNSKPVLRKPYLSEVLLFNVSQNELESVLDEYIKQSVYVDGPESTLVL